MPATPGSGISVNLRHSGHVMECLSRFKIIIKIQFNNKIHCVHV